MTKMNLPLTYSGFGKYKQMDKDDLINSIAEHHAPKFYKYWNRNRRDPDHYGVGEWMQTQTLTDIDPIHELFDTVEDRFYEKYGDEYENKFYEILNWFVKRYEYEIEMRIIDILI